MSYDFTVTGKTKAEVIIKLRVAIASVIASQPVHAADVPYLASGVEGLVHVHRDPKEDEAMRVRVSGSVWAQNHVEAGYDRTPPGTPGEGELNSVAFSVDITFEPLPKPAESPDTAAADSSAQA